MATTDGSVEFSKIIVNTYKQYGKSAVIRVAEHILEQSKNYGDNAPLINGAVCETLLMILTLDYIKENNIKAKCYNSLVLRDISHQDQNRVLENDMIIATPKFIATVECKSYKGALSIGSPCTINRSKGNSTDVYKQTQTHLRSLKQYAQSFAVQGLGASVPIVAFCFIFSKGTIEDKRSIEDKAKLPVITVNSLDTFYDKLFKTFDSKKTAYNYDKMIGIFDKLNCSRVAHENHRKYVGY